MAFATSLRGLMAFRAKPDFVDLNFAINPGNKARGRNLSSLWENSSIPKSFSEASLNDLVIRGWRTRAVVWHVCGLGCWKQNNQLIHIDIQSTYIANLVYRIHCTRRNVCATRWLVVVS